MGPCFLLSLSIWVQPSNLDSPFPALRLQFQSQPCEVDARGTYRWRYEARGRRQEAGGRRREEGPPVLRCTYSPTSPTARAIEQLRAVQYSSFVQKQKCPHHCPLPRLTGRSSTGKKVRQGQAGRRASSCQCQSISHRSIFEGGGQLPGQVNPSTSPAPCLPYSALLCPSIPFWGTQVPRYLPESGRCAFPPFLQRQSPHE